MSNRNPFAVRSTNQTSQSTLNAFFKPKNGGSGQVKSQTTGSSNAINGNNNAVKQNDFFAIKSKHQFQNTSQGPGQGKQLAPSFTDLFDQDDDDLRIIDSVTVSQKSTTTISKSTMQQFPVQKKPRKPLEIKKLSPPVKRKLAPWEQTSVKTKKLSNPRLKQQTPPSQTQQDLTSLSLSAEQQHVVDIVIKNGENVFFTGAAGTGKSFLLKHLISKLKRKYSTGVAITASTGLAAVTIGGITINRFAGCGIGTDPAHVLATRIKKKQMVRDRWLSTKVLIIDEISMIDSQFFDKLNYIAKFILGNNKPFGGIQLVITGDFFQLPPVIKGNNAQQQQNKFCFQSKAWSESIQNTILLKKVFRQNDQDFIDLLNSLRMGEIDDQMNEKFLELSRPVNYNNDNILPTELFSTRREVDLANTKRLDSINNPIVTFQADDRVPMPSRAYELDATMAVKTLYLKEDAQVLMLKNIDDEIVNGSLGIVMCFITMELYTSICLLYEDMGCTQSNTLTACKQLSKCVGEAEISSSVLKFINDSIHSEKLLKLATRAQLQPKSLNLPLVKFSVSNRNSKIMLVEKQEFFPDSATDYEKDHGLIRRYQLPLLLSWALSIHKSQGQTLDRVKVDLRSVFEEGQVYVALSRAVSKERLQILNFNRTKIKSNETVKEFYKNLHSIN